LQLYQLAGPKVANMSRVLSIRLYCLSLSFHFSPPLLICHIQTLALAPCSARPNNATAQCTPEALPEVSVGDAKRHLSVSVFLPNCQISAFNLALRAQKDSKDSTFIAQKWHSFSGLAWAQLSRLSLGIK